MSISRRMAQTLDFTRTPSALAFMARAILTPRRGGLRPALPTLGASWRGHAVAGAPLEDFLALTGLRGHPLWPLLYPHVIGFRLQMAVLTARAFPLPIWNALQIRNRLVLHRPIERGTLIDFAVDAVAQRVLEKGAEIDLRTTARTAEGLAWEGINTFYYRGRFGGRDEPSPAAATPVVAGGDPASWTMQTSGRLRCGRLTGDYNGIHLADAYARRFGFRGAFQHPQRVLGECLAKLHCPRVALPLQLEVWLKGPVYYGAAVELRSGAGAGALAFALHVNGDARPAIVGRLGGAEAAAQTRRPV